MEKHEYILSKVKRRVTSIVPDARIILYGSRARGDEREDSDWDFLVLLDHGTYSWKLENLILASIYELELETGEIITSFVTTHEHAWKFQLAQFYQQINKEGIIL
ncbi:MAG: nucleotidyltransferase domain-containing protein [Bacteroidota bacterium]